MDDSHFTTHVDLPVAPSDAWELIGDACALGAWLGGDVDLEIEPGAEGSMTGSMTGSMSETGSVGDPDDFTVILVEEVVPGERLGLRWASASKSPSTVVFEIVPMAESTRIIITERPVPQGLAAIAGRLCAVR
jgi:uncharacterized protein YndB with AHSA1/START domain